MTFGTNETGKYVKQRRHSLPLHFRIYIESRVTNIVLYLVISQVCVEYVDFHVNPHFIFDKTPSSENKKVSYITSDI